MKKYLFLASLLINAANAQEPLEQSALRKPMIIGGTEVTDPNLYPWMASIVKADEANANVGKFCGGTLVAPNWVLTAAHCVTYSDSLIIEPPSSLDVVLGRLQLSNGSIGERIAAINIVVHPNYDPVSVDSDLALIQLAQASTLTPVEITNQNDDALVAPGTNVTAIGWGFTVDDQPSSSVDILRHVSTPTVSNVTCEAGYDNSVGALDWLTANMLCAGLSAGGQSTCSGDSGGPLVAVDANTGFKQVGIASWGHDCAAPDQYSVYTRLSQFRHFIDQTVAGISSYTFDIDGNNDADALTDGLLVLRYLFNFTGDTLVNGTIANNATRTTANDITAYFVAMGNILDVDGNGQMDALTDGLLILRYLFNFTGDILINGIVAADATRTSATDIESYLANYMPNSGFTLADGSFSGEDVSFLVSDNSSLVKTFKYTFSLCGSTSSVTLFSDFAINNNEFSYNSFDGKVNVTGVFIDANHAKVKITWTDFDFGCQSDLSGSRTYYADRE